MIYNTYNEQSSSPNQTVQGRSNSLYVNEDVPVLPRRYHEKLREGDETKNKKRIYPESEYPDLYNKGDGNDADSDTSTIFSNDKEPDEGDGDTDGGENIE